MLEISIDFTSSIEVFVAHSGPKLSYTFKPLGNEFFIKAQPLLFEQGIQAIEIQVEAWNGIPCFFKSSSDSKLPFDIFAAAFYLITRYEEMTVHLKDVQGSYAPKQSLAVRHNFIEMPVIDHWVFRLHQQLDAHFLDFPKLQKKNPKWKFIFEMALPYRYLKRSLFAAISDFFSALFRLHLIHILNQFAVSLRLKKDPYDTYGRFEYLSKIHHWEPHFFVLYCDNTLYESTTNIHNASYQLLIKGLSDFSRVSLLLSYEAQRARKFLRKDISNLSNLTHRPITAVRMHRGLVHGHRSYSLLGDEEITSDFSMGYSDLIGYRAGTAVPFYYFDLANEIQLPLILYPVVATAVGLKRQVPENAFLKLQQLYEQLPLPTAWHCVAFTNEILNENKSNVTWANAFIKYLAWHATKK